MRSFLFSAVLTAVASQCTEANATASAVAEYGDADAIGVMCGVDWRGDDKRSVKQSNPAQCFGSCFNLNEDIGIQTWTNYEGGTCWCKKNWVGNVHLDPQIVPNAGAITYAERAFRQDDPPARFVALVPNLDIPGYDIGYTPIADVGQCVTACVNAPGCFAFTWTLYNGGSCYLKGRASAGVPFTNDYGGGSGIVMRRDTNQCRPL